MRPTTALVALAHPARAARAVVRWPVESQQRSRRNAMLAATDLTDRRRQTLVVEEHLADYLEAWHARHAPLAAQG